MESILLALVAAAALFGGCSRDGLGGADDLDGGATVHADLSPAPDLKLCRTFEEQLGGCPCGNSCQNPDPAHGADGCPIWSCETRCPPLTVLVDPRPYASSFPLKGPVAVDLRPAKGQTTVDPSFLSVLKGPKGSVAVAGTFRARPTQDHPDRWEFAPESPLAPDTTYRLTWRETARCRGEALEALFSTVARPMVAGVYVVVDAEGRVHVNLRFSEPIEPATLAGNLSILGNGTSQPFSLSQIDPLRFRAALTQAATLPRRGSVTVQVRFGAAIATADGRTLEPSAFGNATAQKDGSCLIDFVASLVLQPETGYCWPGLPCAPSDGD